MKAGWSSITFFLVGMMVMLIAGNSRREQFDRISVKEFELIDSRGQQRASIKVEEGGEVVFRLKDSEGTIRVKIGASREGSGLVLLDEDTNPGIQALAKKEGAVLTLTNARGEKRQY